MKKEQKKRIKDKVISIKRFCNRHRIAVESEERFLRGTLQLAWGPVKPTVHRGAPSLVR